MNVIFNLPTPELEAKCVAEGLAKGLVGLKGHRSIGGMRASIYNAMSTEGVQALVDFLREFQESVQTRGRYVTPALSFLHIFQFKCFY